MTHIVRTSSSASIYSILIYTATFSKTWHRFHVTRDPAENLGLELESDQFLEAQSSWNQHLKLSRR